MDTNEKYKMFVTMTSDRIGKYAALSYNPWLGVPDFFNVGGRLITRRLVSLLQSCDHSALIGDQIQHIVDRVEISEYAVDIYMCKSHRGELSVTMDSNEEIKIHVSSPAGEVAGCVTLQDLQAEVKAVYGN